MANENKLSDFIEYSSKLNGYEKGEAQLFLDRLFIAFGHQGVLEAGASLEYQIKTAKYDLVWEEINRQLDSLGLVVRNGSIQDATFVTADPGHGRSDKPRGYEAKTRRSRDDTWTMKGSKSSFGYKLHSKVDGEFGLIKDLETTTASLHDSQADLSEEGEVVYRDNRYFGVEAKCYSATMNRGTRGHPLSIQDEMRNQRIAKKRAPGERHYAVIKRVFRAAHVMVTTIARVHIKMIFNATAFI